MKLVINYNSVEYMDILKKEDNKEKKYIIRCIIASVFLLALFIICSFILEGLGKFAAYLILMFLAVKSFSFSEYDLMSRTAYGESLYLLSEWKRKLGNKKDNEIFAKIDNGEVLVFDGSNYVSLSWLLKDFNYNGPVPETFGTLTITAQDGEVKVEFV